MVRLGNGGVSGGCGGGDGGGGGTRGIVLTMQPFLYASSPNRHFARTC